MAVKKLAGAIVGNTSVNFEALIYARKAAEAEFIIQRARSTRTSFLKAYNIKRDGVDQTQEPPEGSLDWPEDIEEVIKEIDILDRYERRARSRRKKAFRKLKGMM